MTRCSVSRALPAPHRRVAHSACVVHFLLFGLRKATELVALLAQGLNTCLKLSASAVQRTERALDGITLALRSAFGLKHVPKLVVGLFQFLLGLPATV